ncbi:DUF1439 domain-containing protein [Photobacterium makurazakiensis]|uniref:DUF1439 domain-containing protein n=1 Tax=Photobacterium makurazakiensis TaxID=2910234 RepID=UPI003D118772
MISKLFKRLIPTLVVLVIGGCASYSITEQEMTQYLQDTVNLDQSVGVENVMYAQVAVEDLKVRIGRADVERVSIFANTNAQVQLLSMKNMGLELDIEFSAIPKYDKESGEVFLNSLRLEHFGESSSQQLPPEIKKLLKPAVSMIGYALSKQPVYKLDSTKVQEALIRSAEPNLVIKNNKLVIELFD